VVRRTLHKLVKLVDLVVAVVVVMGLAVLVVRQQMDRGVLVVMGCIVLLEPQVGAEVLGVLVKMEMILAMVVMV